MQKEACTSFLCLMKTNINNKELSHRFGKSFFKTSFCFRHLSKIANEARTKDLLIKNSSKRFLALASCAVFMRKMLKQEQTQQKGKVSIVALVLASLLVLASRSFSM